MRPNKYQVEDTTGEVRFIVFGYVVESHLMLSHPYPDFSADAGWVARSGDVRLTFNGPRDGQRIPCTRG